MKFRLVCSLLVLGLVGCAEGNTSAQNASQSGLTRPSEQADQRPRSAKPVNRLGAHFDQSSNPGADRHAEFQAVVARNMGGQFSSRSVPADENDGESLLQISPDSPTHLSAFNSAPQDNNRFGENELQSINIRPTSQPPSKPAASIVDNGSFVIPFCTVEFIDDIELPAQEAGQIKSISVKEGDPVQAGKVIGQIDDELYSRMLQQAKFRLSIAQQKANDTTSLMAAENEINLNQVIYKRTQDLNLRGSAPTSELQEAEFRYKLALLKKTAAQNEIDNANVETKIEMARVGETEERIRRHMISTNFDCYVIELFRHPLEWVNAGDKVARVARMDRLWVQGVVSSAEWNSHELVNCPVTVKLNLARNETTTFEGRIVNVSLERQGSDQIWVRAEVENRPIKGHWVLQPNSTVDMTVHVDQQPGGAATAGNFQLPSNR